MFFNLIKKNSSKNRKENALFFTSLIVSIVAFYIILSLENQDVIIFLKTMESDAVNKLLLLTPALYFLSLFILFFLVYFAGKYQLERRSHEFGMYLMLGMRRSKLFFMLFLEEILNSFISLIIGIPIAVFLSEMISMITAKIVGFGIINHNFSFSMSAVLFTACGYFLIRITALFILSIKISRHDITQLLSKSQEQKHKVYNKVFTLIKLVLGITLLVISISLAINGYAWNILRNMFLAIILGLLGTFLLFNGIGVLFQSIIKNRSDKNGLEIFTFRQLQENVFQNSNSLAISSLLLLSALCCFGYGISMSLNSSNSNRNVLHYTFKGKESEIRTTLNELGINNYINTLFEVKTGILSKNIDNDADAFSAQNLLEAIDKEGPSLEKDQLLNNLRLYDSPHLISLSGYNEILKLSGKETLTLNDNEVALYSDIDYSYGKTADILNKALKENLNVEIKGEEFKLLNNLYQDSIVTDRFITIGYGLILPDNIYKELTNEQNSSSYFNASLKDNFIKEKGLMKSIMIVNELLNKTSLTYESYLQNMGRQLFYTVAASYTTLYLAIIFLIIANTIIGVQFLIQQQKTSKRYKTLINLGCYYEILSKSARNQIKWYFSIPVLIASILSIFAVKALFTGAVPLAMEAKVDSLMYIVIPVIILLCMIEFIYMIAVMRISDKNIQALMNIKRDDN